jgi:hypothetical protein
MKKTNQPDVPTASPELAQALREMNWSHGRGDIKGIYLDDHDGAGGTVNRVMPHAGEDMRRFRLRGQTLHFLGHRRKLKGAKEAQHGS